MARKPKSKHKTADEKAKLLAQAKRLMSAKVNPLSTKDAAKILGVPVQFLYYNGCNAKALRPAPQPPKPTKGTRYANPARQFAV